MKQRLLAALLLSASLSACGGRPPARDPAGALHVDLRGYEAPIGVLMGPDEKAMWVQAAVRGFRPARESDIPKRVEVLPPKPDCSFTQPSAEERLAKVQVTTSDMKAPIFGLSHEDIGRRTALFVTHYANDPRKAKPTFDIAGDQFSLVDVVVTEISKPVYLVIAYGGSTIFNFQLVEGARLSRIVLIGQGEAGVANVDPAVPVELVSGSQGAICGANPIRRPAEHWTFVKNAKERPQLQDALADIHGRFTTYNEWHRRSFGVGSEPELIGAEGASHVLVGPLPSTPKGRVRFKSLKGSHVRVGESEIGFVGSSAAYRKMNADLVRAAAAEVAGGDLDSMRPAF